MVPPRIDVVVMALALAVVLGGAEGAGRVRARLRPAPADDELLYRAEERAAADDRVVLVPADPYDLYRADDRLDDDRYEQRAQPAPRHHQQLRAKEAPKAPPVQTIRNYNKVNDDGSFTFGYEAADGSFKEETRGTDCVVRGKYGYVDPDGNKREFTYVSGNPCDPNRPDEDSGAPDSAELDDDEPANYPSRPPPQPRPTAARPPTAYFQNDYRDDAEEEPLQHIRQRVVQRPRPAPAPRPTYAPVAITPRPQAVTTARALLPATTFRPQLLAIPQATPEPQLQYSPSPTPTYSQSPAPHLLTSARPGGGAIDFAAEFAKFQRDNAQPAAGPEAGGGRPAPLQQRPAGSPIYSTELVFDPSSGQYDTQLYQTLPQTKGELNLNQRLQPYVAQAQPRPFVPSQQLSAAPPPPLFRHQIQHAAPPQRNPQEAYQRQQADTQFQNSAQLFAQQQQLQQSQLQRDRAAARLQAQRLAGGGAPSSQPARQPQPQFYYVAPRGGAGGEPQSSGQIDAFLRGHGIQF